METMPLTIEGPDGLLISLDVAATDHDGLRAEMEDRAGHVRRRPQEIDQDRHPALTGSDFWTVR